MMTKLLLLSGLLLAPLAAMGQTVINVYPDATLVTVPSGQPALACFTPSYFFLPLICSLPADLAGLTVGEVEVYDEDGSRVVAVLQITTDENGSPLAQYFTPDNSAGRPTPQPTRLATLYFDASGEADFFEDGVEFRLFHYPL
jgi:hypothetical protein